MAVDKELELKKHLYWCIDEICLGIKSQKPTSKQAIECKKILKVLTSGKAAVVKKRQMMRQTFGDYRKKIDAEDAKWEKQMLRVTKLQGFNRKAKPLGTGYRFAISKRLTAGDLTLRKLCGLALSDEHFLFNFQIEQTLS